MRAGFLEGRHPGVIAHAAELPGRARLIGRRRRQDACGRRPMGSTWALNHVGLDLRNDRYNACFSRAPSGAARGVALRIRTTIRPTSPLDYAIRKPQRLGGSDRKLFRVRAAYHCARP